MKLYLVLEGHETVRYEIGWVPDPPTAAKLIQAMNKAIEEMEIWAEIAEHFHDIQENSG